MKSTCILGIRNRTENWRTASFFAPLIARRRQSALAGEIIRNAKGAAASLDQDNVRLELYWKGFRDYCHDAGKTKNDQEFAHQVAERYRAKFPDLPDRILKYNCCTGPGRPALNLNRERNYVCRDQASEMLLYSNLLNTEIDIVMETPGYVLIGEAKHKERFGAASRHVLGSPANPPVCLWPPS